VGSQRHQWIINIITRNAAKTQGWSASTSSGMEEGYSASLRYGGAIGDKLAYRVFGRASYTEPGENPSGANTYDFWNLSQGGLRLDWNPTNKDALTIQSGFYEGRIQDDIPYFSGPGTPQTPLRSSYVVRGGHIQSHWHHRLSESSSTDLAGCCDWTDRVNFADELRDTCRLEFQNGFNLGPRQSLIWGGSLDVTNSSLYQSFTARGIPAEQRATTAGGFAQYEINVIPDRLRLIAGSKFEHDSYTGFEIQPQIRGVWTPTDAHSVWAAVSRAVRVPSRVPVRRGV
jgi:iron complex outermembrane receptor protein